jgi:hypothetical protein
MIARNKTGHRQTCVQNSQTQAILGRFQVRNPGPYRALPHDWAFWSYTDRAAGLLDPAARNRSRFIQIAIRFRQNRPDIPRPETPPSSSNDGYPAENL